ncbi:MAG: hypothetical protein HZA23_05360 [Nitrospirae bacterium]|nr:hypothetical protein [Nitrospirota bacterium]
MTDDLTWRLDIMRGEYAEMPGLRLTAAQAARLWALDERLCHAMLAQLVNEGFLRRTRDGAYVLRNGGIP